MTVHGTVNWGEARTKGNIGVSGLSAPYFGLGRPALAHVLVALENLHFGRPFPIFGAKVERDQQGTMQL